MMQQMPESGRPLAAGGTTSAPTRRSQPGTTPMTKSAASMVYVVPRASSLTLGSDFKSSLDAAVWVDVGIPTTCAERATLVPESAPTLARGYRGNKEKLKDGFAQESTNHSVTEGLLRLFSVSSVVSF